jgi:hypothetical protein
MWKCQNTHYYHWKPITMTVIWQFYLFTQDTIQSATKEAFLKIIMEFLFL